MDAQSEIIREIYATALESEPWVDVFAKTARQLKATAAQGMVFALPQDGGFWRSNNLPDDVVARYVAEVDVVDVWYHELLRRYRSLPVGLIYQSDDLVPRTEVVRTRFHADYLIPCDIGCNIGLMIGDGSSPEVPRSALSFYRPVGGIAFGSAETTTLALLQPHFTQALRMRLQMAQHVHRYGALAMEACRTAVVMVSQSRRIVFANPAAEKLLARRTTCFSSGRLSAEKPSINAAMEKAITACSSFRFNVSQPNIFRLSDVPGAGVLARIAPIPGTNALPLSAALAFLSEEAAAPVDLAALAAKAYGLTAAEVRLVNGLLSGNTPEEIAELRSIALSTIKTQLRSVFNKTGVRRQSDLMRVLFSIAH